MHVFNLKVEQAFDPKKHVEKVLGHIADGDVTRRLLGARSVQPEPPASGRNRNLLLFRGWRDHAGAGWQC